MQITDGMERLSGLDSTFLYAEAPNAPLNVLAVVELAEGSFPEGGLRSALRAVLEQRLARVPKLRKRRREVPLGLDHPIWEDDPDFDLDWHIRHVALPPPADRQALEGLVADIASRPVVPERPLWEVWAVEGLEAGRSAVVFKIHHAVMDGLSGAAALLALFDDGEASGQGPGAPSPAVEEPMSLLELTARSLWSSTLRVSVGQIASGALWATGAVAGLVRDWALLPSDPRDRTPLPFEGPDLSFNGVVSASRRVGLAVVPWPQVIDAKRRFDLTVNEVVLAALCEALRGELLRAGERPVQPLVAAIPVGLSRPESGSGNHVSATLARLPVDEVSRRARVDAVRRQSRAAKEGHDTTSAAGLPSFAQHLWPPLVRAAVDAASRLRLGERLPSPVNLVVSNVPGPDRELRLAGARVASVCPFGPIFDGVGLNVTVLSYGETLGVGVTVGTESAVDAERLADGFVEAVADLAEGESDAPAVRTEEERAGPGRAVLG